MPHGDGVCLSEKALRNVLSAVLAQANVPDSLPVSAYAYRLGRIDGYLCGIRDMMKTNSEEGNVRT